MKVRYRLDAIAKDRNKQYIFMEIGCRSVEGASTHPWDFTEVLKWNEQEQADFFQSCMDVFLPSPYFAGVFWWDWPTFSYSDRKVAEQDKGFSIHLKKAEKIVKEYNDKFGK